MPPQCSPWALLAARAPSCLCYFRCCLWYFGVGLPSSQGRWRCPYLPSLFTFSLAFSLSSSLLHSPSLSFVSAYSPITSPEADGLLHYPTQCRPSPLLILPPLSPSPSLSLPPNISHFTISFLSLSLSSSLSFSLLDHTHDWPHFPIKRPESKNFTHLRVGWVLSPSHSVRQCPPTPYLLSSPSLIPSPQSSAISEKKGREMVCVC